MEEKDQLALLIQIQTAYLAVGAALAGVAVAIIAIALDEESGPFAISAVVVVLLLGLVLVLRSAWHLYYYAKRAGEDEIK